MKTTSLEAYENVRSKIPRDQQLILSVLDEKNDMTYREIARAVYLKLTKQGDWDNSVQWLNPVKAMRRMSELVRLDKVDEKTKRECSISGTNCTGYVKL